MCKNALRWVFRLDADYSWDSGLPFDRDDAFADAADPGRVRLILRRGGTITVTSGYAWDGCTPKFCLLDLVFGTPDGVVSRRTGRPKAYYASLIHDALYQFLPDGLPLSRWQADKCFLALLRRDEFAWRFVYFTVVVLAGWATRPIYRRVRATRGRLVEPGAA
jgi:hypothetical protein